MMLRFYRNGVSAERRWLQKTEKCGFLPKAATPALRRFSEFLFVALFMLAGGIAARAQDGTNAAPVPAAMQADSGGISDAEIFGVVARVARHQIRPLADGDYPAATNMDEALAAKSPAGLDWNYQWGVALYGMLRSMDVTGDKDMGRFVVEHNQICARDYAWMAGLEKQFGKSADLSSFERKSSLHYLMALGTLDSCGAMGNQLLESMMRHPDQVTPEEKALVARIADWVVNRQDRMPDGTLWRADRMGGTVWPDDLYMGGVFLVRYGIYTGDRKYIDDAASNIIHQAALEQDSDGLWFHGYFETNKMHAPFKWGRGDGWATVTMVETLSAMPENDPLRPQLLDILRRQIDGLKKVQAPDGMWRQVLDKPELWEETSCTAMFAYGIARAVNRGWIDATNMVVARRAFAGIAKQVTPDGAVNGTCEGTGIGDSLDFYIKRRQPANDSHGRGPVLLAGTEILLAAKK
jgi:rhamnogalacturonyl hydrolase YesR